MADDRSALRDLVRVVHFLGDNYRSLTPRTRKRILRDVERGLENLADSDLEFGLPLGPRPERTDSILVGTAKCTGPRPMATESCRVPFQRADEPGTLVVRAQDLARGVARVREVIDDLSVSDGEALATDLAFITAQLDHQSSERGPSHPGLQEE